MSDNDTDVETKVPGFASSGSLPGFSIGGPGWPTTTAGSLGNHTSGMGPPLVTPTLTVPLPFMLAQLNGAVIFIESKREGHHGCYIDASDTRARVTPTYPEECLNPANTSIRWKLHHIRQNIVVLESVLYPEHYLDMNDEKHWGRHVQRVTRHHRVPLCTDTETWAQFRVRGTSLDDVAFQSLRWPDRWLDTHEDLRLYGTRSPDQPKDDPAFENTHDWARFRILRNADYCPARMSSL